MKKVAVLAANGKSGRFLVLEALRAGAEVSAFVRSGFDMEWLKNRLNTESCADSKDSQADFSAQGSEHSCTDSANTESRIDSQNLLARLHIIQKDIFALESSDLQGFNVVLDAFGEWQDLSLHRKHIEHLARIWAGNLAALLVVGGAGSLYMDSTHSTRLMDLPSFPSEYLGVARATAEVLDFLRAEDSIRWLYVSPAAEFDSESESIGAVRVLGEEFATGKNGKSYITYAAYAREMVSIALDSKRLESLLHSRIGLIEG